MHNYEGLEVWQIGYRLVLDLYESTRRFPRDERFGLIAQIRSAAVSIPANIAEGSRRNTRGEFRHFLGMAAGSNAELQVLIRLSADLGFMPPDIAARHRKTTQDIDRKLRGLILSLGPEKSKRRRPPTP